MKMPLRSLLFLLAALAPAAIFVQAQQAATEETANPQIQKMQQVEDQWSEALAKRDQYGLELVLSPQFVDISASGDVRSRNQEIARILNGYPDLISLEQKVVTVRVLGNVAVVNGTYMLRRRVNGHPLDEKGVFSHIFQQSRSTWQCINAQRTVVVEEQVGKTKNPQTAKKSGAELPFHVPLFHKGEDAPSASTATPSAAAPSNTPAPN